MTILIADGNNLAQSDERTLRVCVTCQEPKPHSEFYKHAARKDGLQRECKVCHRVRAENWAKANPEKVKSHQKKYRESLDPEVVAEQIRRRNYKVAYGITIEQYDEMFEAQGGVCAICSQPPPEDRRLAVDHNAKTGVVRQLLCGQCNTGIGLFREDVEIMAQAIAYIERHAA